MEQPMIPRPGRSISSRPFSLCPGLTILVCTCLLLPVPEPAGAQVSTLWPEVARLLAPEVGLTGIREADLLPVAGWGLPGAGRTARPGATPVSNPFTWLKADLPLVQYEATGEIIYRASRAGHRAADVGSRGWGVSVAVPLDDDSWSMLWGGSGVALTTDVMIRGEAGSFRRNPEIRNVWLGVRRKSAGVDLLAAGGRSGISGSLDIYTLAVRMGPVRNLNLSAWVAGMSGRDEMVVTYRDARAEVGAPATRSSAGLRLEGRLAGWDLLIRMEQTKITAERNADLEHQLRPRPLIRLAELRVTSDEGTWWGALGVEGSRYRASLDSNGLRYGRFLLDDTRGWFRVGRDISPGSHTWRLWAGVTRAKWDGEGEFEFWPFTPTIVDLLGLKRRGNAGAGMSLISAGTHVIAGGQGGGTEVHVGLDMHALWTDGELESWEPFLLGLGKTNIIRDSLPIRSVQIADIGVVLSLPVTRGIGIRTGAAQLIPIASQRRALPGGGEPGDPGRPGSRVEWGGLRWWFTLHLTEAWFRGRDSGGGRQD